VPQADDVPDQTGGLEASPALAMVTENTWPVDGRVVQILACDGADLEGIRVVQAAVLDAGAVPHLVAPHKGAIVSADGTDQLTVDRSFLTASSAEADALVVAAGTTSLASQPAVLTYVQSAHRHHKAIAVWGDGAEILAAAAIEPAGPGMVVTEAAGSCGSGVITAMTTHRAWERAGVHPTRAGRSLAAAAKRPAPSTEQAGGKKAVAKKAAQKASGKKAVAKKAGKKAQTKTQKKAQKKGGR
jgi:hypothetical protein